MRDIGNIIFINGMVLFVCIIIGLYQKNEINNLELRITEMNDHVEICGQQIKKLYYITDVLSTNQLKEK